MERREVLLHWLAIYYQEQDMLRAQKKHSEIAKIQDDNIAYMRQIVELNPVLTSDQQYIFERVYDSKINSILYSIEQILKQLDQPDVPPGSKEKMKEILQTLKNEVKDIIRSCLRLIDGKIMTLAVRPAERFFYERLKAKYHRYICENTTGQESAAAREASRKCYEIAMEAAKSIFEVFAPEYLELTLNFIDFASKVLHRQDKALDMAKKAHTDILDIVATLEEPMYSQTISVLRKLTKLINSADQ